MKWSAAALAAVLLALVPATARAATYEVQLCAEPQGTGFAPKNEEAAPFFVTLSCPYATSNPFGGVYVGTSTSGETMSRGKVASWTLTAPAGLSFDAVILRRKLTRLDSDYAVEVLKSDGTVVDTCLADNDCDHGFLMVTHRRAREFTFRVRCAARTCGTSKAGPRAAYQIASGTARIEDTTLPAVSSLSLAWRRTADVAVSATDVGGVASLEIATSSRVLGTTNLACDYRRLSPCPLTGTATIATGLPDGIHAVTVRATDAAKQTATSTGTLRIDSAAPGSPLDLAVQATGSGTYAYTWTNPDQGAASPIVAAHLSDGTIVKGANIQSLESASADERIYLEDEAGNTDPATAATVGTTTGGSGSGAPVPLNPPILRTTTKPKIKLSSAKRQGTRLVVKGTVTNATATKITATVKRGSRTVRKSANVTRGRFTIRIALNSSMRRKGTVSLTVRHGTAKATKRVRF